MVQIIFMQYICKYCGKIYLDKDIKGRMTPIKGYYCPECVEKYGFVNPEFPPKKQLYESQIETLKKHQFPKGKNRLNSNENRFFEEQHGDEQND